MILVAITRNLLLTEWYISLVHILLQCEILLQTGIMFGEAGFFFFKKTRFIEGVVPTRRPCLGWLGFYVVDF